MTNYTQGSVQINDGLLQNYLAAYLNDPGTYVADLIFPRVGVNERSGKYVTLGTETRKHESLNYSPGANVRRTTFGYTTDTYSVEDKAVEHTIAWDIMSNQKSPIDLEAHAAMILRDKMMLDKEIEISTMLSTAGNWGSNTGTPGTLWDVNGDFVADFADAASSVQKVTSKRPNVAVLGRQVFDALKTNTKFTDRNFLTGIGVSTEDAMKNYLAGLLNVKAVYIAETSYDTTDLGQTASNDWVWGKDAWLLYIPENTGIMNPSFGMQPTMDNLSILSYDENQIRSKVLQAHESYDIVATYALGYHFDAVIS